MSGLPSSWTRTPIGDLCELLNGRAFKPTDWSESGLPIVRIQNLNNPGASLNRFDGEVRERFLIDSGELLFAWSGTPGTSFGAHIWGGGPAILNQHIFKIEFSEQHLEKRYFRYAIDQKLQELIDKAHGGVGLRHVTKGKFEETEIELPPLAEQRRIAAKLDSLRARSARAREELDRIPKLIERYKQAILAKAFSGDLTADWRTFKGDLSPVVPRPASAIRSKYHEALATPFSPPSEIAEGWQWLTLPQLGELDRGKSRHRPRNDPRLFGGPYLFIQTGEVRQADRFIVSAEQTLSEFGLAQSRLWPCGTVCITIAANIAETAVLGVDACFPDSVVGFIADTDKTVPSFVEFFIRTAREDLNAFAPATAQKNINLDTLGSLRVPAPPIDEQLEIVRRIEHAFTWLDKIAAEHARAAHLLPRLDQAILAKAFRGDLVPQDPNDEPASALLARIKAERGAAPAANRRRRSQS